MGNQVLRFIANKLAYSLAVWLVHVGWVSTDQTTQTENIFFGIVLGALSWLWSWYEARRHNKSKAVVSILQSSFPSAVAQARAKVNAPTPNGLGPGLFVILLPLFVILPAFDIQAQTFTTGQAASIVAGDVASWLFTHGSIAGGYFCAPEISHGKLKLNDAGEGAGEVVCPDFASFRVFGTFSNEFGAAAAQVASQKTRNLLLATWQVQVIPPSLKPSPGTNFWAAVRQKLGGTKLALYVGSDIDRAQWRMGFAGSLPVGD